MLPELLPVIGIVSVTSSPTSMTLLTRGDIQQLLREHQLKPSRALGQNFLADPNTVRRIARLAAVGPGDRVVEVGAGLGSLTLGLAQSGAAVTAVETDRYLLPVLRSVLATRGADGVDVIKADAMRLDWGSLLGDQRGWSLVANLPYNVATPLTLDLLDSVPGIDRMLIMVQREVGERLAAGPGGSAYGAASVKVAYWASAEVVGRVPASVFIPRPNVESVLVRIRRRPMPAVDPAVVPATELFELVRAGFAQRRKMLRRSLAGVIASEAFALARVEPTARPEDLDVVAWGRLAACRS
jgi:16S rRNA (adenine1518-N6/adenine1519-N6)-dimethyltransferase